MQDIHETNKKLAIAVQVKRVFDLLDCIDDGSDSVDVECEECGDCFSVALYEQSDVSALRAEMTDLLNALGVEVPHEGL